MVSTLPPILPRPDGAECRWHGVQRMPRVAFPAGAPRGIITPLMPLPNGLMICTYCDMGAPDAGPPVLLDYLRKGHQ